MTADTTEASYWLNWRFLLCAIWVLLSMIFASSVIWKYEDFNKSNRQKREDQQEPTRNLSKDEGWRSCIREIHPAWLLSFRLFGFIVLSALLIANVAIDGGGIFYFYTQWTFALVTLYFGLGSSLSIYGCCQNHNRVAGDRVDSAGVDVERCTYLAPTLNGDANISSISKSLNSEGETNVCPRAGFWSYSFQIMFQMCAGAVILTDIVFWFVIYPFLTAADFRLNFLIVCMHSINAVFLLGDTILNCLRFPFFRIAYFILWTAVYVIFQWVIHACVSLWWPYPFLDLSSSFAPLWYLAVGVMHIPCYGIFALIMRMKHSLLSGMFPDSYQCMK